MHHKVLICIYASLQQLRVSRLFWSLNLFMVVNLPYQSHVDNSCFLLVHFAWFCSKTNWIEEISTNCSI